MTMKDLDVKANELADVLCRRINKTVPARVDDMPYARQYVLEKVIQELTRRV